MARVLLVDDNLDTLDSLQTLLGLLGHETAAYADAPSALAALASQPGHFDLALLDLCLPGVDGFELCRRMRAAAGGDTRLVALTGQPGQAERAAASGFDSLLLKPARVDQLQRLLANVGRAG
jgi:two-component system, sensor histidine kinase